MDAILAIIILGAFGYLIYWSMMQKKKHNEILMPVFRETGYEYRAYVKFKGESLVQSVPAAVLIRSGYMKIVPVQGGQLGVPIEFNTAKLRLQHPSQNGKEDTDELYFWTTTEAGIELRHEIEDIAERALDENGTVTSVRSGVEIKGASANKLYDVLVQSGAQPSK